MIFFKSYSISNGGIEPDKSLTDVCKFLFLPLNSFINDQALNTLGGISLGLINTTPKYGLLKKLKIRFL
jgi:hypothetical protein